MKTPIRCPVCEGKGVTPWPQPPMPISSGGTAITPINPPFVGGWMCLCCGGKGWTMQESFDPAFISPPQSPFFSASPPDTFIPPVQVLWNKDTDPIPGSPLWHFRLSQIACENTTPQGFVDHLWNFLQIQGIKNSPLPK